jgi:predicted dehydrogenase
MSTERSIGIGIVGSGLMARTYAETLAKYVRGCEFVAVAVGSRAPQLAQDYGVACEPSLESLAARSDVDGLIITTPEMPRIAQVRIAARAGKHVLLEKPMAANVADCDTIIDICRAAGISVMQVQSQRFRAIHQRARQLLDADRIGQVWQVRITSMLEAKWSQAVLRERPWYLDPLCGGLLMSQVVHNFDMLRLMAGGDAKRVFAHGRPGTGDSLTDLSMQAQVVFGNGVSAHLWVCMETPAVAFPRSVFRTQVIGEKGMLDFDGYTHLDLCAAGEIGESPPGASGRARAEGWERVMEQEPFNALDPKDPVRLRSFSAQNQEFVDAIRERRAPAVTAADGRAAVEMAQAAMMSAKSGRLIELPFT